MENGHVAVVKDIEGLTTKQVVGFWVDLGGDGAVTAAAAAAASVGDDGVKVAL